MEKEENEHLVISQSLLEVFRKKDPAAIPTNTTNLKTIPLHEEERKKRKLKIGRADNRSIKAKAITTRKIIPLNKEKRKLYIDILNFYNKFFRSTKRSMKLITDWEQDYRRAIQKVGRFVKAALNSNIEIEIFVDQTISTRETAKKWKMRRNRDMQKQLVKMIPGTKLIGDFFRNKKIPVHYSTVDNDDTIAAFAFRDGADILSADRDFFRYRTSDKRNMPYKLFSSFSIEQGHLILDLHEGSKKPDISYREVLVPPPLTRSDPFHGVLGDMSDARLSIFDMKETNARKCYIRGLNTCLTQEFENPHMTIKPLRQALYSRLNLGVVREIYPTWEGEVQWITEDTGEDPTMDEMLENPNSAFVAIFGHQLKPDGPKTKYRDLCWKNHVFSQKLLIAEMCAWARGLKVSTVMDSFH